MTVLQKQDQMGYLGMLSLELLLIKGEKSEQKYFDTGVIMVDSELPYGEWLSHEKIEEKIKQKEKSCWLCIW